MGVEETSAVARIVAARRCVERGRRIGVMRRALSWERFAEQDADKTNRLSLGFQTRISCTTSASSSQRRPYVPYVVLRKQRRVHGRTVRHGHIAEKLLHLSG